MHCTAADSIPLQNVATHLKVFFCSMSVFTVFTLILFQGCLLGQLIQPPPARPLASNFDELRQLISDADYKLDLITRDNSLAQLVRRPNTPAMWALNRSLARNPPIFSRMDDAAGDDKIVLRFRTLFYQLFENSEQCQYQYLEVRAAWNELYLYSMCITNSSFVQYNCYYNT